MIEADLMRHLMKLATKLGSRVFRNNVAQAWTGSRIENINRPMKVNVDRGDVVIWGARPVHAGLCVGSSDIIGWTPVTITQDMVGDRLAVFTAVEVKTDRGRATDEQKNFIARVREAGGYAGIARNDQDLTLILCPDLSLAQPVDKITPERNDAHAAE